MAILNHRFVLIFTVIASLCVLGRQSDKYFGWTNEKNIKSDHALTIHTDGSGYYAYLPKWFIYPESKGFNFLKKITDDYQQPHFLSGIRIDEDYPAGIDKYYVGTAILSAPLFLINHGVNLLLFEEGDGYSRSYQLSVSFNALLFYLLGLLGFIRVLKFFKLRNGIIALSIILLTFGTNLNFYTVYFPAFSHVFSFALIAWFFYFSLVFGSNQSKKYLVLLAFLLGLIFLVRPTNIILVLILPFCFSSIKGFIKEIKNLFKTQKTILFSSLFIFIFLVSLQLIVNFFQLGNFTFNSYNGESFTFLLNPKWTEVLFSFKKGYFIYAPIMLLSIPGLYFLYQLKKSLFFGWMITIIFLLYVTSSWWCWWYGGGLGMRPFVDFLPLLFLPIALLLKNINKYLLFGFIIVSCFGIYLYQVFQIQYNKNVLHYDGVTKEQFSKIFLKTDNRFSWMLHFKEQHIEGDYIKINSFHLYQLNKWSDTLKTNKEMILDFETSDPIFSLKINNSEENNKLAFRFKGEMMLTMPESNPSFEVTFYKGGEEVKKDYQYIGNRINHLNKWEAFQKDFIPGIKNNDVDSIRFQMTKGYPLTYIKNIEVQQFLKR